MSQLQQFYGTGRRKTASARVFLRPGSGGIEINGRSIGEYFSSDALTMIAQQPLALTETGDQLDFVITVRGGGGAGQAGAVRHGIARALVEYDAELRDKLKSAGYLTRDDRKKERKKYGQKGARARYQFSKR
ncbi:MAG: 30S ribosomal protein S9 [Acidobacteriota bacterium]